MKQPEHLGVVAQRYLGRAGKILNRSRMEPSRLNLAEEFDECMLLPTGFRATTTFIFTLYRVTVINRTRILTSEREMSFMIPVTIHSRIII